MTTVVLATVLAACLTADTSSIDLNGPSLGVAVRSAEGLREKFKKSRVKFPAASGVIVMYVLPGGPAAAAKIGPLDVITHLNDDKVDDASEFVRIVESLPFDNRCRVTYYKYSSRGRAAKWTKESVGLTPVRMREALQGTLKGETDSVTGVTTFNHVSNPESPRSETTCYAKIHRKGGESQLVLAFQRVGSETLHIREIILNVDGKAFTINARPLGVHYDLSGSASWEWCDLPVSDKEADLVAALAAAGDVTIRFSGIDYRDDHEMSIEERGRLQSTLLAYRAMTKR